MLTAYQAIKAIDSRPVAVVFVTGQCQFGPGSIDPAYLPAFDLLMFDFYPFYRNVPGIDPEHEGQKAFGNCATSARQYHKLGPIIVLQGFGRGQHDGQFDWRDPTLAEESCQIDLAVAAGATGILFWDDQYADRAVQQNTASLIANRQPWHQVRPVPVPTVLPAGCQLGSFSSRPGPTASPTG